MSKEKKSEEKQNDYSFHGYRKTSEKGKKKM